MPSKEQVDAALGLHSAMITNAVERGTEPLDGYYLPRSALSDIAADHLDQLILRAKGSHVCDVTLRLAGREQRYQADWVKYLSRVKRG